MPQFDFSSLPPPPTPAQQAALAAETEASLREAWETERKSKIKFHEIYTRKAGVDFATRRHLSSGDFVVGFRALGKNKQPMLMRWTFHADDERSARALEERLATEDLKFDARGYFQPVTTTKGRTFAFQIVESAVTTTRVHDDLKAQFRADQGLDPPEASAPGEPVAAKTTRKGVSPERASRKAEARDPQVVQTPSSDVRSDVQTDAAPSMDASPAPAAGPSPAVEAGLSTIATPQAAPHPEAAPQEVVDRRLQSVEHQKNEPRKDKPMNAHAPVAAVAADPVAAPHAGEHGKPAASVEAAPAKPVQRAAGARQVRLPIDDFRMTAPQAGPARKIVADLQPQVLEGLKLLPQWAAIERLGGHVKWSSNIVWRMLDEARAVDPLRDDEDPQNVPQRHVDMATQLVNWHLRRMSGIGGSEVGVLVGEKRGMPPKFETTARTIVAIKLCMALPERTNKYMTRGHRAEPFIRDEFMRMHPHARRDETGLRIAKGGRPAFAPWLIGSPDDMIIVTDPQTGKRQRVIPDYKSMGENSIKDVRANGVPFDYKCQLHHYGVISSAAGVSSSGAWLVPFDSQAWTPLVYDVPWDVDLTKECLDVARQVWRDNVLSGVLPEEAVTSEISKDGMRDPAAQLAVLDAAALAIAAKKEAILTALTETLNTRREEGVADFGPWTLKAKTRYDAEQIKDLAFAFGVETAPFVAADPKSPDKDACVGIAQSFVDAMKVRDASEAQLAGSGQEAFLRALTIVEEKVANGIPLKTSLNVEALSKAIIEKGGEPKCAITFSAEFACSRKKAEYPKLASFREDVAEVVGETIAYCGQAVFNRWPELAHSDVIAQMEAENPDAAEALGATG